MANNLVGLFDDRDTAQSAVNDLIAAGIARDRISVVASDASGGYTTEAVDESGNLAAEGAASGITSGAVVGGLAGLLIGAGFTFLPVAGFLIAGPIAGLLTGAVAGAATGGVVGGLIGLGIPQEHAELYAEGVRRGGSLVTVQAEASEESWVRDILNRDGAVDIDQRSADWRGRGYTGWDANAKPFNEAEIADERARYATPINSDWNDTANAPAPSADATYAGRDLTTDSSMMSTNPSTGFAERTMGDVDWNDDTAYREHFQNTNPTGDFSRHAPAYGYGRDLANDPTYGTGDWDMNETSYRSRWEERNPGTWDEFKASIRHGWDKAKMAVTGDNNRASMR